MSGPHDRRGFLRGLVSLPLIGGGVTLVGQPTKAAVPVTDLLMDQYVAWLVHEHRAALVERERRKAEARVGDLLRAGQRPVARYVESVERDTFEHPYMFWFPSARD